MLAEMGAIPCGLGTVAAWDVVFIAAGGSSSEIHGTSHSHIDATLPRSFSLFSVTKKTLKNTRKHFTTDH